MYQYLQVNLDNVALGSKQRQNTKLAYSVDSNPENVNSLQRVVKLNVTFLLKLLRVSSKAKTS